MSRGNRIDEAIVKLFAGDMENALIQISICIDATAKKKYPKIKKVGVRVKKYIMESEDLIVHFMMNGQLKIVADGGFTFSDKGDLGEVLYKSIRCALLHEADISDEVVFRTGPLMGMEDSRFVVTDNLLWGLVLLLVGDSTNEKEQLKSPHKMSYSGTEIVINEMFGQIDNIKKLTGYVSLDSIGVE